MEGVRIFDFAQLDCNSVKAAKDKTAHDLKQVLSGLAKHMFGDVEMRWSEDYFPFTEPSFELEILYKGEWLEILGCGVIHDEVMQRGGRDI